MHWQSFQAERRHQPARFQFTLRQKQAFEADASRPPPR